MRRGLIRPFTVIGKSDPTLPFTVRIVMSALSPSGTVTVIEPLTHFYLAEGYHQDFYRSNPYQPYCLFVIDPKMQKFRKEFRHKLGETAGA